jgi:hypothetical protein
LSKSPSLEGVSESKADRWGSRYSPGCREAVKSNDEKRKPKVELAQELKLSQEGDRRGSLVRTAGPPGGADSA